MREGFCKEMIFKDWHNYQCTRKVWKDGYCKQHHPDTIKARRGAQDRKWQEQKKINERNRTFLNYQTVIKLTKEHGFKEVGEYFRAKLNELDDKGGD